MDCKYFVPKTASLAAWDTLNFKTRFAGILMHSTILKFFFASSAFEITFGITACANESTLS